MDKQNNTITQETILGWWNQYKDEVHYTWEPGISMLCTLDTQFLYSAVRHLKPSKVLELGAWTGRNSSSSLVDAVKKNNVPCSILSFDLLDDSSGVDYDDGTTSRKLIVGDIAETLKGHTDDVDFVFIDADHRYEFGKWYSENLIPLLAPGTIVFIHDWEGWSHNEDEFLAVTKYALDTGLLKPIMNLMDYCMANKHLSATPNELGFSVGDRSPMAILQRTSVPNATWLTSAALQQILEDLGYKVKLKEGEIHAVKNGTDQ